MRHPWSCTSLAGTTIGYMLVLAGCSRTFPPGCLSCALRPAAEWDHEWADHPT